MRVGALIQSLATRWMGKLVPMVTEQASSPLLPTVENGCLDSCTTGNSFIGVSALVQFFSIEEVLQKFLNLGDSGRTTHQDNIMDL